jgi:uncharacterized protein YdhG (YjbR/CyaY superfamily)
MMTPVKTNDIDRYIAAYPREMQVLLQQMRETILKAAPKAEETISYRMPYYKFQGRLLYFAGHKHHIGFYPTGSGITAFKKELSAYKGAKGSVQFPLDQPLPVSLIRKIVKFRVQENLERARSKEQKKK